MSITLHYFPTPNGKKISIALEEMTLPYRLAFVNIFAGEGVTPDYLQICPNGRIPALVDEVEGQDKVTIFESGAILQYLGRKTGLFYPTESEARRAEVDSWLMWQMAGLGPMTGQLTWFKRAGQKPGRDPAETSLAIHRYRKEIARLYAVLDRQLAGRDHICGAYSIADMACWPWVDQHGDYVGVENYPNIAAWHARIAARPAVQRGLAVGLDLVPADLGR